MFFQNNRGERQREEGRTFEVGLVDLQEALLAYDNPVRKGLFTIFTGALPPEESFWQGTSLDRSVAVSV